MTQFIVTIGKSFKAILTSENEDVTLMSFVSSLLKMFEEYYESIELTNREVSIRVEDYRDDSYIVIRADIAYIYAWLAEE